MKRALCAATSALLLMALGSGCKNDNGQAPTPPPAQTTTPTASATPSTPATTWETQKTPPAVSGTMGPPAQTSKVVTTKSGLQYEDIVVGTGASPKAGQTVIVKYLGTFQDGTKFDASADHGDGTFPFAIGEGQVIKGWDEGVMSMKVGGKRKLIVPPSLGYGENGMPPVIPANATLLFTVELVSIQQ